MKVVDFEQGTPEWHAWRSDGLGSSDVSAIAAHANLVEYKPWMKSISRVYEEKMGLRPKETFDSWRIRRGHAGEGFVRAVVSEKLGQMFVPMCVENDEQPMLRSSLDGLNIHSTHILEIKNPNDVVHALAKAGVIVDYYLVQMLSQAVNVWGHPLEWAPGKYLVFASGRPEDRTVHIVTREAIEFRDMATGLYDVMIDFIDCMHHQRPPMGETFMDRASRYAALYREAEMLKRSMNSVKSEMIEMLKHGGKTRASGGSVTISWQEPTQVISSVEDLIKGLGLSEEVVAPFKKERTGYWRVSVPSQRARGRKENEEERD